MWMHNGSIAAWKYVKRRLAMSLADQWFRMVQGSTDSEWAFALFLDELQKMGVDPDAEPGEGGFGHAVLRRAMVQTIKNINDFVKELPPEETEEEKNTSSFLNFAVTDGHSVICSRYINSTTDEAASLYFSSGTSWMDEGNGEFKMERRDKGSDIVLVASEPLTFERGRMLLLFLEKILS
jgi:glutamine amidotransferase